MYVSSTGSEAAGGGGGGGGGGGVMWFMAKLRDSEVIRGSVYPL